MSVQNDIFALTEAGAVGTVDALKLAAGYKNEKDYSIWNDLASSLKSLHYLYSAEGCDFLDDFNLYLQR